MSSDVSSPAPETKDEDMLPYLGFRGIFWLTLGSLLIPIYLIACILSIIKAYSDRKIIKTRILARQMCQNPPIPLSPVDIIAREVRENRWHKRTSSLALVKIRSLLRANPPPNSGASTKSNVTNSNSVGREKGLDPGDHEAPREDVKKNREAGDESGAGDRSRFEI
ncbi:hypothetical protein EGW08_020860 [Elysia chlorotica]|uniref:Uncharacterized protein n=1 Tax=Elysia chlorotica TaxID=188477 RepID=A0A433SQ43_ELYCH|nr:hypothetical protein EGW08_020860 [Elysia chlorotica]